MGGGAKDSKTVLWSVGSLLAVASLLALAWQLAASASQKPYLPPPLEVLERLLEGLIGGDMRREALLTLRRVLISVSIAAAAGVSLGLLSARLPLGYRALRPLILATYPIPHVTLVPLLLWIFGVESSKIAVISLITFYPVALSTMEWALRTPREYEELVETMGGNLWHKVLYVIIPYMLPGVLTGLRISISTAFAVVFVAESFVLTGGLGALIEESWHRLDYATVYASVLLLSAMGLSSYAIIWFAERAYRSRIE